MDKCDKPDCPERSGDRPMRDRLHDMERDVGYIREGVSDLKLVIKGDGNGNIGLVRKLDNAVIRLAYIERLAWLAIGGVVVQVVKMIFGG